MDRNFPAHPLYGGADGKFNRPSTQPKSPTYPANLIFKIIAEGDTIILNSQFSILN